MTVAAAPATRGTGTWASRLRWVSQEPVLFLAIGLVWLWLLLLVIYPLAQVLTASVFPGDHFSLSAFGRVFGLPYYRRVVANSLVLATLVAMIGTLLGLAYAFATTKVEIPGRTAFHLLALLPTISPPFFVGLSIIMLLGRRGLLTHGLLGLSTRGIYGLPGLVIAQTLGFFPFAYLLLRSLLLALDPSLEEVAMTLGADRRRVLTTVTLPVLISGIASAFLLLFIYSLTDLGNALILSGDYSVLASQIYMTIIGQYNISLGSALAIVLLAPSVILFLWHKALERRSTFATITGRPSRSPARITEPGIVVPALLLCLMVGAGIISVYLTMLGGAVARLWGVDHTPTLDHFRSIFGPFTLGFKALRDTVSLAIVASLLGGLAGLVIAYLVRRVPFWGRDLMDFLSTLPMAVPGIVIGIGFAIAFNKPPLLLSGTAAIIVLIFAVRTMPYGLRAAVAAVGQIEPAIDEASLILGASRAQTFRRIIFPLTRPAFVAGMIYNFTRNITTLSAVIFVVSARWNLVTAAMLAEVDAGRIGGAAAFGVFLVVLVLNVNAFLYRYVERGGWAGRLME